MKIYCKNLKNKKKKISKHLGLPHLVSYTQIPAYHGQSCPPAQRLNIISHTPTGHSLGEQACHSSWHSLLHRQQTQPLRGYSHTG